MRLGEILLNAKLIDQRQLSDGLAYAQSKAIPIGRVLKLLRFIDEQDLQNALRVQELIRQGLRSELAVPLLSKVGKDKKITVERAMIDLLNSLYARSTSTPAEPAGRPVAVAAGKSAVGAKNQAEQMSPAELVKEGDLRLAEDRCNEAEKLYLQAKEHAEALFGAGNLETTRPLLKLAHLYLVTDRFSEAESLYMQILQVKQQSFGEQHPAVAEALEDIGDLYVARQEYERARQFLHIAVMIREKSLPKDIDAFLVTLRKLNAAMTAKDAGQKAEGKNLRLGELLIDAGLVGSAQLQQALQQSRSSGAPLGSVLQESNMVSGRDLRSVLHAQFAVKEGTLSDFIAVKALKAAYMKQVGFKELIAAAGLVGGQSDPGQLKLILEQEKLLALEIEHGADAAIVADAVVSLADEYAARGSLPEAEAMYRRAMAIYRKHSQAAAAGDEVAQRLARLYMSHKKYSQAEPLLLQTLQSKSSGGPSASIDAFVCLKDLARISHLQDNSAVAANFLRSAVSVLLSLAEDHIVGPDDLHWMLICLADTGQLILAQNLLDHQIDRLEKKYGSGALEPAKMHEQAGDFLLSNDNRVEAKQHYRKALLGFRQHLPSGDPAITKLADKLSKCAM